MHCLACYFGNLKVNWVRWWEYSGRVLRPISLWPCNLRSVPAKAGRETPPTFRNHAPNDCFPCSEAGLPTSLPMIACRQTKQCFKKAVGNSMSTEDPCFPKLHPNPMGFYNKVLNPLMTMPPASMQFAPTCPK